MTHLQAKYLASFERDYSARCIRGEWLVWSAAADHKVEFDRLPTDEELDRFVESHQP